jgi:hypothetical protein
MKTFHQERIYENKRRRELQFEMKETTRKSSLFHDITSKAVDDIFNNKKRNNNNNSSMTTDDIVGSSTSSSSSAIIKPLSNDNDCDQNYDIEESNANHQSYYWDDDGGQTNITDNNNDVFIHQSMMSIEDYQGLHSSSSSSSFLPNTISNRKSALDLTIPSYSIVNLSRHLTKLSLQPSFKMFDDQEKLVQGNLNAVKKGSFARVMNHWFQENSITKAARNGLMNILQNTLGANVNLPIRLLDVSYDEDKNKINQQESSYTHVINKGISDDNVNEELESICVENNDVSGDDVSIQTIQKSDDENSDSSVAVESIKSVSSNELEKCHAESIVEKYDVKIARFIQIDQCVNDCFVYAGENTNKFSCPKCNEIRFRPCCRTLCKGRGTSTCEHLYKDGVAFKQMFYRPLLILIADLLKTTHFLTALNYERKPNISQSSESYTDFMDGEIAKTHLENMKEIFSEWQLQHHDMRADSVSVNLLLSEFYDGAQLFKNQVNNFWVLMTQILNLPPTYRGKLGIGMFIQAIYAGKHMPAEKFLFIDNFCEELRLLYYGVEINVSGVSYFIQARLVLHTLDTRAAEAVLNLQSTSNSKSGCPLCRGITGCYMGNKCVYIGHRQMLPSNHYLRFLGQSGKCCPKNFYHPINQTKDLWVDEKFLSRTDSFAITDVASIMKFEKSVVQEERAQKKADQSKKRKRSDEEIELTSRKVVWNRGDIKAENLEFCQPCNGDIEGIRHLEEFLFKGNSTYQWSHDDNDFNFLGNKITCKEKGLRKFLFYRHFDLRPFNSHKRVTYEQHMSDALQARLINKTNRSKTLIGINGIKDIWYFDRLPYANIPKQVTWPLVHAISGIVKLLSGIIIGVLSDTSASKKDGNKRQSKPKSSSVTKKREVERVDVEDIDDDGDEEENNEYSDGFDEYTYQDSGGNNQYKMTSLEKNALFNSYRPNNNGGKQPYEASKKDNTRCREWLRCILLPSAMDDDSYEMKGFLQHDGKLGFMKMNQRLKLVSSFWEVVILSLNDLADQYRLFYRMIAKDISKLLSFNFSKQSIAKIKEDLIESICLWEGLLPVKNCTFQLHELIDLVDFIPLFGPPMGVSEFPGERALGRVIKDKLKNNTGGVSFEKSMMQNHINFELQNLQTFYKEAISKTKSQGKKQPPNNPLNCKLDSRTGILSFNSIPFSLFKPELHDAKTKPYLKLSPYEIDHLIDTMILEVKKQYGSDEKMCENNSCIYRIESLRLEEYKDLTPFEWLNYNLNTNNRETCELTMEELDVCRAILQFEPKFFGAAHIYGMQFTSRGSWLRETQKPKLARYGVQSKEYEEHNIKGSLKRSWYVAASYGSWCRFEQEGKQHSYGQINTFFTIKIGDKSIDGLIVAAVTARKYSNIPKSSVDMISCKCSLDIKTIFVATTDIYPTRIATLPLSFNKVAISVKKKIKDSEFATSNLSEFVYLYMISLHPEKLVNSSKFRSYKVLQL